MARFFKKGRLLGTVLNVAGLTVAFTAFMVIMIQVLYDWGYDRNYSDSDRIFRLEFVQDPSSPDIYDMVICRPFIEELKGTIPEVEELGVYNYWQGSTSNWMKPGDEEHYYGLPSAVLDTCMLRVFPPSSSPRAIRRSSPVRRAYFWQNR